MNRIRNLVCCILGFRVGLVMISWVHFSQIRLLKMVSLRVWQCLVFFFMLFTENKSLTVTKPFFNYLYPKEPLLCRFWYFMVPASYGLFSMGRDREFKEQHYSPFVRLVWNKDLHSLLSLWVDFNPNFMGRVSFVKRLSLS